jgi:hypothetical protein
MIVNKDKVPLDSEHLGETGARKFPARPGLGNLQDGISLGGTETGDPADTPPKEGYGLTEPAKRTGKKTPKSKGIAGKSPSR